MELPTACADAMMTVLMPSTFAVSTCSAANMTLELAPLPVRKAPSSPMKGEASGKSFPVAFAIPCASRKVIPESTMTKAIMTMVMMPTLVGMHCENVDLKDLTAAPFCHRPAARNTRKLRIAAISNSGAGWEILIREYIFSALTAKFMPVLIAG